MLTIHGVDDDGAEYAAAVAIAKSASDSIPGLREAGDLSLDLFPRAQCFGQRIQDIDLLILFADCRSPEKLNKTKTGIAIHSFCATVEVKKHTSESVRFQGATCFVTYKGQDHEVTAQSEGQKYSLRNYLVRNSETGKAPFVINLIWLVNVPNQALPRVESNIMGANTSWADLCEKVAFLGANQSRKELYTFGSLRSLRAVADVFAKILESSKLDRRRIEALTKNVFDIEKKQYAQKLGEQLLIIRGRGGTGKTVRLIQIGHQAYDELGLRVLLLTYNKALVADIRRLLAIRGIRDEIGGSSMSIKTIHSFLYEWFRALEVLTTRCDDFLEKFEFYKKEALDLINKGALSEEDVLAVKARASRDLAWDLILVDESQDWPTSERDLLYRLYDYKKVVIADGVDQFVRGTDRINWREMIPVSKSQVVRLHKSLRLKAALCNTVNLIAAQMEISDWDLEPFPEAYGGKVIVVTGNGLTKSFHDRIVATSRHDGNKPVDMLLCVPPSSVKVIVSPTEPDKETHRESNVAKMYRNWGHQVWDAVDAAQRGEYPTSLDQFRVVQYDSCRGLEGWVVVCLCLDEFYLHKKTHAESTPEQRADMYYDQAAAADLFAKRWMMIPLTRAIDTLVIHVSDPNSYVGKMLRAVYEQNPDSMEWLSYM